MRPLRLDMVVGMATFRKLIDMTTDEWDFDHRRNPRQVYAYALTIVFAG